ncbi:uncharacterized protein PV09_05698 [Verruconis gallopava]|uniref:Uncharacterized protein n=1 Tax=Verruconis gallopava TaxID=253628 RepID=A0A0D1XL25_9PEZI|nr:uncharacterized protein PV09_05698 [Verruconis gallopava]KIW03046.1 hypothetical protein PV09_05698 [Verruconis gallopava]
MPASKERKDEPSRSAAPDKASEAGESEAGGVDLPEEINEDATGAATASSRSGRRKRRPKRNGGKHEAEPTSAQQASTATSEFAIVVEVQALKSKVYEIEQQVREILLRPQGPPKSARRRQRHQKGQRASTPPAEEAAEARAAEDAALASHARDELRRLQRELDAAQSELLSLRAREESPSRPGPGRGADDDGAEEIPRLQDPGVEVRRPRPLGRAITLTGSYRIPLPVDVSSEDLDAIGRGIRSAQNVARSFISDFEHARALGAAASSSSSLPPRRQREGDGSGSWSEWFGGYSMSIARAVEGVRLTSRIQTTPVPTKPAVVGRAETTPARRKPRKLEVRSHKHELGVQEGDVRRRLSEGQVAGLLA